MSASVPMFDKDLCFADDSNDDDDDEDDDDDDGEATMKFASPSSKQCHNAGNEVTDFDVYWGDLRTFCMANFPPMKLVDVSKLKGSDFLSDDEENDEDDESDNAFSMPITKKSEF